MRQEITQFLAYIGTERGLSPRTVEAYRYDLSKFSEFINKELGEGWTWDDVDQYLIRAYMQFLADTGYKKGNAGASRGRKLATIKSFFSYLYSDGKVKSNPASQVKMPKIPEKEPAYLTEQEYKRLLRVVRKNATKYFKARDIAIITTLLGTGLRVSELTGLNVGNVSFDDGVIKVTRKGNHERILPVPGEVMISIQRHLRTKKDATSSAPLFVSKRGTRMVSGSIEYVVKKYLKQAQIEKDKLSPHTLRHTFATILLRQGENILTIKELMSHKNLRTTERYLHINSEDLKAAVGKIDLNV